MFDAAKMRVRSDRLNLIAKSPYLLHSCDVKVKNPLATASEARERKNA